MRFSIVALPDISPEQLARWRRLADRAIEPNHNADPRFLHSSLGFGLGAEEVQLAIVASGGEFALVLPFTAARRLSGAPVRHAATDGEFMYDQAAKYHPLVAPEDPVAAMRELFLGMRAAGEPDLINFTAFPTDGPLMATLENLRDQGVIRLVERARDRRAYARRADLDPTGGVWQVDAEHPLNFPLPHLSKRTRRNMRRGTEGISEETGGPLQFRQAPVEQTLLEGFLELQAVGWKGEAEKSGPQFRRRGREQWFRHVLSAFDQDGNAHLWHLSAGGETVYIGISLRSGGTWFGFHDVYSERFRPNSPGLIGRLAMLGALQRDPEAPPFDPGMDPSYVRAGVAYPSEREYAELLVAGPSRRSRAVVAAFPAMRRLRSRLRDRRRDGES